MCSKIERFYIEGLPTKPIYGPNVILDVNPWPDSDESREIDKLREEHKEKAEAWLRENFVGPTRSIVFFYLSLELDYHLQTYQYDDENPTAPVQPIYNAGYTASLPDGGNVSYAFYVMKTSENGPMRRLLIQARTPYYAPPPGKDGMFSINLNITSLDCDQWAGAGRSTFTYNYDSDGHILFDGRNIIRLLPPGEFDKSVTNDELKFGSSPIDYFYIQLIRNS